MLSMMQRLNMGLLCIQQVVGNSEYKYAAGNSQRMDVDVKKPEDKLSEYEKRDQESETIKPRPFSPMRCVLSLRSLL